MTRYVAAIDQGTTSTRCILFDHDGQIVAVDQNEHEQIFPRPGWVEHDPREIWAAHARCVAGALARPMSAPATSPPSGSPTSARRRSSGTARTGEPVHNAIVWQDTRTDSDLRRLAALSGGPDRFRDRTGLPLATYFAGPKVRWILDHVDGAREAAERGRAAPSARSTPGCSGTLTGGPDGGVTSPTSPTPRARC